MHDGAKGEFGIFPVFVEYIFIKLNERMHELLIKTINTAIHYWTNSSIYYLKSLVNIKISTLFLISFEKCDQWAFR